MPLRKCKILYRVCALFFALLVVTFALLLGVWIAEFLCEDSARFVPSYAKEDLSEVLEKEVWSEEDYAFLYRQTGLGKSAIDGLDRAQIPRFQDALFYEGELGHEKVAFATKRDTLFYSCGEYGEAPVIPLQNGDVLLSFGTHSLGWRHGHVALVVDAERGDVLESAALGKPSKVAFYEVKQFLKMSNFIVLRLKDASLEERGEIAQSAKEHLVGIPYSIVTGIFTKKDGGLSPRVTQCAHLVWQAFYNFGYDIDSNGGGLVLPQDIVRSPLFEVMQVNGCNLDKFC